MEKRELQRLLNQPYNKENWKRIVQFVFPNVSVLAKPNELTIPNDKIKKFSQIGNVRLNDGKNLALFELVLADNVNIQRNRVELNNEISKYIDQEQIHGVLSVFEQGGDDYRFTFSAKSTEFDLAESDFVQKKTDTKRYTYLLGKNESCKTPADRFYKLSENKSEVDINAIQNAFSVEQLSKEFFDKYKKQFEKFWKYIDSKEEYKNVFINGQGEREVKIRNFTKKLLGRIVFLHFLQKKGWMGCPENESWGSGDKKFMQSLFNDFANKDQFHSQCLVELFYNTLNTNRVDFLFKCEGLEGVLNNSKIPYLNGGLFDSDQLESKKIDFPESYFQDLFEFFGQYNFTIDENDPNDHEVGIDPEMLGHIFENLLEDNKDKGAFYTPKVIVQYMCQESLIEYLATKLEAETSDEVKLAIEDLIRNQLVEDISDLDLVEPIAQALFDVKICDPAIGSGAFPMGVLNVIYEVIEALYYLQPDSVARVWNISDKQWQPHLVKKNIIQHSIYGVDIESGAVDIARLRFWLALVVDELEPLPLPNLDYKIMQGNSLLESFEGIDLSQISNAAAYEAVYESEQIELFSGEAKKKVSMSLQFEDVKTLMDDYFNANEPEIKKDLHKRIDDQLLNHIRFTLSEHKRELQKKAKKLEKKVSLDEATARTWDQKEKIRTKSKAAKALVKLNNELSQYNDKELKLAQLSNSNDRPFFLWHLFFQEVFNKGGFDIVIGNPPYRQLKWIDNSEELENFYQVYSKSTDLYCIFYEKANKIIKENGVGCFITSNKWLRAVYGTKLRDYFHSNTYPRLLIDFKGFQIFDTATVDTNILIWSKSYYEKMSKVVGVDTSFSRKTDLSKYVNNNHTLNKFNLAESWITLSGAELDLKIKINKNSSQLSDLCELNYGILTGSNNAFIIDKELRDKLISQDPNNINIIKPILRGKDLIPFGCVFNQVYLINAHNGVKNNNIPPVNIERDYPSILSYFSSFGDKFRNRGEQGDNWYNLRNCAYINKFENEKIIYSDIVQSRGKFYYDELGYYTNDTAFIITGDKLKYLTGLLNSNLLSYAYSKFYGGGQLGDKGLRYKKEFLGKLPIKIGSNNEVDKIEEIVSNLTFNNCSENEKINFKIELNNIIYKIYKINDEEINLIERSLNEVKENEI